MALPIEEIAIRNMLSFGDQAEPIPLRSLNVLIGANGSGKSNFIECLNLFTALPINLGDHINDQGGILNWLWKGQEVTKGSVKISGTIRTRGSSTYSHFLSIGKIEQSIYVDDETIELSGVQGRNARKPLFVYEAGVPCLRVTRKKLLDRADYDQTESAVWRDQPSEVLVAMESLSRFYRSFRVYRGRSLNHSGPAKQPQRFEQFNDYLLPGAQNLGAVLNRMNLENSSKHVLTAMRTVNEDIEEIITSVQSGTLQIYLREKSLNLPTPASRISDGTFRWLCLIAILTGPSVPPLMFIEEPDIGLHPDVIVELAAMLRKASERTQLIVTTHSDTLIDALSDTPEAVLVCEKVEGETSIKRLSESDLRIWLEEYGLGQLWRRGDLGGNRY